MRPHKHARMSLARRLFVFQLTVILLLVGTGTALVSVEVRRDVRSDAEQRVLSLATDLARQSAVRHALSSRDPSAALQPLASSVRRETGTDFIVFMATDRTRYSHPDPERIGQPFIGTIAPAVAGHGFTETYEGTLGPSVRAVVPIRDRSDGSGDGDGGQDGRGPVRALVSVGILQEHIGAELRRRLTPVVLVAVAALLVAGAGSWAISRKVHRHRQGGGTDPDELTRLYEHHDTALRTVREGLLTVGPDGEVVLVNEHARQLLRLPENAEGRRLHALGLRPPIAGLLSSGEQLRDELCVYGDRVLVLNQERISRHGRPLGTVATLRDHTELRSRSGPAESSGPVASASPAGAED